MRAGVVVGRLVVVAGGFVEGAGALVVGAGALVVVTGFLEVVGAGVVLLTGVVEGPAVFGGTVGA